MQEIIIKVNGMMCGGCENRVKNALSLVEGIQTVEADYNDGIVKINAKDTFQVEELKKIIDNLGFEVVKED